MSEPKRPSRWSWKWKAAMGAAGIVLLLVGWSHLSLAAYIARVVYEEYPDGMAPDRWVHRDHLASLAQWPPNQLSHYLNAPWPEWRAVVCHAYTHAEWPADADWTGVPTALTPVALADRDPLVRNLAVRAFGETVGRAPNDYPLVVEQVTTAAPSPEHNLMVRAMARQPVDQEPLRKALTPYLDSDDRDERALAFELLARVAPADLTLEQLRHLLTDPEKQDRNRWVTALNTAGASRRDLFRDLLAGSETEQSLAIASLPNDAELLAAAQPVAERFLRGQTPPRKSTWVLRNCPNGGHLLLKAWADAESPLSRELLVEELREFFRDRQAAENFTFTPEESLLLMDRLSNSDDAIRVEVLKILSVNPSQSQRMLHTSPGKTGPKNPSTSEVFLELLGSSNGQVSGYAWQYIHQSGLLGEADIPQLVAIARRNPHSEYSSYAARILMNLFPTHPETRATAVEIALQNGPAAEFARHFLEANSAPLAPGSNANGGPR